MGTGHTIAVAVNADGRLETFGTAPDGSLWHAWQTAPQGSAWTSWVSLASSGITDLAVGREQNGELLLVALAGGHAQMIYQAPTGNGWSAWASLSSPALARIALGRNADGRLEAFGLATADGALWHAYQTAPNGGWSTWTSLAGSGFTDLAATLSGATLTVFASGANGTQMIGQAPSPGGWGPWSALGGPTTGLAAATDASGHAELFGLAPNATVAHWVASQWSQLGTLTASALAVGANTSTRLEAFALSNGQLQHDWQTAAGSATWSGWASLGTPGPAFIQVAATATTDASGHLCVLAIDGDNHAWRISQANSGNGWGAWTPMGTIGAQRIEHVVMLMLENRGFDSALGTLYTRAAPPRTILPAGGPAFQGLDGATLPTQHATHNGAPISGAPVLAVIGANSPGKDPGEPYANVNRQLFGSPNPPPRGATPTMTGFLQDYCDELDSGATATQCKQILRMFTPDDLPKLNALAGAYGVSDQWFCSVPTQTNANRAFSVCGTSGGEVDNGYYPAGIRGWVFACDAFETDTIWNVLDRNGVSWAVYYNEAYPPIPPYQAPYTWLAFPRVQTTQNAWSHFHQIDQFFTDARAGQLPAFTYLEPKWGGEAPTGYVDGNDYHPPVDITHSELMLQQIYTALRANANAWQKTLLVVVFDEHGGTYDHVAPPWGATPSTAAVPAGSWSGIKPPQYGFGFDRFGVRVPCLLASPWIGPQTVVRSETPVPFDHTSILASILDWKNIDRTSCLGPRVAVAPTFWHALSLSSPRTDDNAFPPVHGPAIGAPLSFGQPFLLKHKASGRFFAGAYSGVRYWFPTLGPGGIELSFRMGYGPVQSDAVVQLRTNESKINAPGAMTIPANTLGAWKDQHDCYYYPSDAYVEYQQESWKIHKPGAASGAQINFGDELTLTSMFYPGQVLTPDGDYVTTSPTAQDTWVVTPMP